MRPNVFIVGTSKIGKTPLATAIAKAIDYRVIGGSEWVRARFEPSERARADRATWLEEIAAFSCAELMRDPDACVDFIRHTYPIGDGGFVIEGLRNPRDFSHLFRPQCDIVVFVYFATNPIRPTVFERYGTQAIQQYVDWLRNTRMIPEKRVLQYRIDALRGQSGAAHELVDIKGPVAALPCWNLDEVKEFVIPTIKELVVAAPASPPTKEVVHAEFSPFTAVVENRVLHDDDPSVDGWTLCKVFAISSYPGHVPTFQVMLENGAMFSYVPPHRLRQWAPSDAFPERFELADLVYHECRDEKITVNRYDLLTRSPCRAYLHKQKRWLDAVYVATVDWYMGNDLLHLVTLENGQFAFLPSHKVMFAEGTTLPTYKKLHAVWRLEEE